MEEFEDFKLGQILNWWDDYSSYVVPASLVYIPCYYTPAENPFDCLDKWMADYLYTGNGLLSTTSHI